MPHIDYGTIVQQCRGWGSSVLKQPEPPSLLTCCGCHSALRWFSHEPPDRRRARDCSRRASQRGKSAGRWVAFSATCRALCRARTAQRVVCLHKRSFKGGSIRLEIASAAQRGAAGRCCAAVVKPSVLLKWSLSDVATLLHVYTHAETAKLCASAAQHLTAAPACSCCCSASRRRDSAATSMPQCASRA